MANPTITVSLGNPDPSANPVSLQELVDVLNPLLSAVMNGTFGGFAMGSTAPVDHDLLWAEIDGNLRPVDFRKFYNGFWRKYPTGLTEEYKIFGGNPATYFDATHLGWTPQSGNNDTWDGWALCTSIGNTNHGVPDLSDKFIVGGNSYGTSWQTKVTDGSTLTQTGGVSTYAIKNTDLPNMQVIVTGMKYDPNANASDNRVIVTNNHSAVEKTDLNPIASFGANPSGTPPVPQTSIPTLPPYYTLAIAKFVGYA